MPHPMTSAIRKDLREYKKSCSPYLKSIQIFMRFTRLIVSSFVATTAWATSNDIYAFFVKHEGKLNPLHLDLENSYKSRLIWNDLTFNATEFIYKDGSAFLNNLSRTGRMAFDNYDGVYFTEETDNEYTTLVLENNTGRLLNFFFYSCEFSNRQIISSQKLNDQCFLVDLYFMKYDRGTKKPLQNLYESKDVERTPRRLYVRDEEGLVPLSIDITNSRGFPFVPFHHRKSGVTPVEIFTQNNLFFAEVGPSFAGYVTSLDQKLVLVGNSRRKVEVNENGKLVSERYFSCKNANSEDREIVTDPLGCSEWKDVDIFLLSYDRKTGKPQLGDLEPKLTFDSTPHTFFVKQEESWVAVSFKDEVEYQNAIAVVPESSESGVKPIEFSVRVGTALTEGTSFPGFAGFNVNHLVVSDYTRQIVFDLDNSSKITNHVFYMEKDRSISVEHPDDPDSPQISLYLLPLNRTSGKPLAYSDMPVDDDETKVTPVSSSTPTMTGTSEFSVSSVPSISDIPETSIQSMSPISQTSARPISDVPVSSIPSVSEIPESSASSMSDSSETSVITVSDVPESFIPSVSEISETSVSTMIESSQSSISNIAKSSESPVSTIAGASSSSGISHAPRPSPSMSSVAGKTSIDESSEWNPTTVTRKTTTTATICTECQAASTITEWYTHTNFVTYCPGRTTMIFSKCNNGCYLSTTTVTSATTVTCPGVCIIPTTIIVNGPAETANVGHYGPKDTVKSPSNVNSPAEAVKVGEGSQNGGANIVAAEGSAQNGGEDIKVEGGSTPESPIGSPSSAKSANRIGKVEDSHKQGDSNKEGDFNKQDDSNKECNSNNQDNSNTQDNSNKPNKESSNPESKSGIASGQRTTDSSRPKSGNSDTTFTQTLTDTVTAPSVSSFNGASKNAIGACILGFAALLL